MKCFFEDKWYELEAFILDQKYLSNLQKKFANCTGVFCGYGVAVKDFQHPIIDFDRNNTYIQSEGIKQDFGVYDSPDELLKNHHQDISAIKTLDEMPMRCRLCEHNDWKSLGLRFLTVDNYLVFYIPDEEKKLVKIYHIIYGKRDIENRLKENITFE